MLKFLFVITAFAGFKIKKSAPCHIFIIDGILVLNEEKLLKIMNLKVFVGVPPVPRFIIRLERDFSERGCSIESVAEQYLDSVLSIDEKLVEPNRDNTPISSFKVPDTIYKLFNCYQHFCKHFQKNYFSGLKISLKHC